MKIQRKTNVEIAEALGIGKSTLLRKISQLGWNFPNPQAANYEQYIGTKKNRLTLTKVLNETDAQHHKYGLFNCDCGKTDVRVLMKNWLDGNTQSCGCKQRDAATGTIKNLVPFPSKDLTGQKNGFLTALRPTDERTPDGSIIWECQCDADCEFCPTNHIHKVSVKRFPNTRACKLHHSSTSLGEKEIMQILEDNNIPYEREYKFADCKDIHALPFDFFLSTYKTLIEFDGEQHFNPKCFASDRFETRQKHDKIKNEYCFSHGFYIIRIPYTKLGSITLSDLLPDTSKYLLNK